MLWLSFSPPRFTPCSSTAPIRVCVKESVPSPSPMRILSTPSRKVNQTPTRVPVQSVCVKRKVWSLKRYLREMKCTFALLRKHQKSKSLNVMSYLRLLNLKKSKPDRFNSLSSISYSPSWSLTMSNIVIVCLSRKIHVCRCPQNFHAQHCAVVKVLLSLQCKSLSFAAVSHL